MKRALLVGAAAALAAVGQAQAQSPNGYATIITLPVVVQSITFGSTIFIHNPQGVTLSVKPDYVGGNGSATVGAVSCPVVLVAASTTAQFSLNTLCPLNPGSNFGRLKLFETNTDNRPFAAYSRVETFNGLNGFSVEDFPIGNIANSKANAYVNGLKRTAAAPGYQTNCFVGSLNEAVTVNVHLEDSAGTLLGAGQDFVLGANELVRLLDVFTVLGASAGDHTNARAVFFENGAGEPSYIAFCTVQNNSNFDADFRIAKTHNSSANDERIRYSSTIIFTSGATTDSAGNVIPDPNSGGIEHNWMIFLQHPDWVACSTNSSTGTLELRLLDPQGNVVAGGDGATSFAETYLGEKSTRNNGVNGLWKLQVGDANFTGVTAYSITCTSGNGMSLPIYGGGSPDDF